MTPQEQIVNYMSRRQRIHNQIVDYRKRNRSILHVKPCQDHLDQLSQQMHEIQYKLTKIKLTTLSYKSNM